MCLLAPRVPRAVWALDRGLCVCVHSLVCGPCLCVQRSHSGLGLMHLVRGSSPCLCVQWSESGPYLCVYCLVRTGTGQTCTSLRVQLHILRVKAVHAVPLKASQVL